jgi:diacylglycerol kinase family enzyme
MAREDQEGFVPPRRALVVANPISGRGRGERLARELARGFERRGVAAEVLLTRARGDAPRLLGAAGAADLVVAVGGDGTLGEVLRGLPERTTPVGLLPCGTANVLAHALRLPRHPERALPAFLHGRIQDLDVGRAGERYAHLVVSIGFDARVVEEVERRRRGPITKAVYVGAILRTLPRYRPVPLRVWIDGRELDRPVGMVWIANTPKYADVLRFARGTRLDDGQWEVYLFPTGRASELIGAALRGLLLHLPGGPITMQRARSVRVEAAEPVPYQVDGDLAGTAPLEFELLSERFRLVVPRDG